MIELFASLVIITIIKMGSCELNTTLSGYKVTEEERNIPVADVIEPGSGQEPTQSPDRFLQRPGKHRIFGGKRTDIELYPFIVSIRYYEQHMCGASYLRPKWVLTAAHCLRTGKEKETLFSVEDLLVMMGSNDMSTKIAQSRKVQKLFTHENYKHKFNINDIGLIKVYTALLSPEALSEPFDLGPKIKLVVVQTAARNLDNVMCTVIGWGFTSKNDSKNERDVSKYLKKVDLKVINKHDCARYWNGPDISQKIKKGAIFCAGTPEGYGSCQGDSGGPFVCDNVQVGIVAGGRGCGSTVPSIYTKVDYHINWIKTHVGSFSYPITKHPVNQSGSISFKYSVYIIILGVFIFKNILWYD